MATSITTNRSFTIDNDNAMYVTYQAQCSAHGGLGTWTAAGTTSAPVPNESSIQNSATQAATSHAGTCESGEW